MKKIGRDIFGNILVVPSMLRVLACENLLGFVSHQGSRHHASPNSLGGVG
jgi:hypothetical protein